jgi:hypothetical protein
MTVRENPETSGLALPTRPPESAYAQLIIGSPRDVAKSAQETLRHPNTARIPIDQRIVDLAEQLAGYDEDDPQKVRSAGKNGILAGRKDEVAHLFYDIHRKTGASVDAIAQQFNDTFDLITKAGLMGGPTLRIHADRLGGDHVRLDLMEDYRKTTTLDHVYFNINLDPDPEAHRRITAGAGDIAKMLKAVDSLASIDRGVLDAGFLTAVLNKQLKDVTGLGASLTLLNAIDDGLNGPVKGPPVIIELVGPKTQVSPALKSYLSAHSNSVALIIHKGNDIASYAYDLNVGR